MESPALVFQCARTNVSELPVHGLYLEDGSIHLGLVDLKERKVGSLTCILESNLGGLLGKDLTELFWCSYHVLTQLLIENGFMSLLVWFFNFCATIVLMSMQI